MPLYIASLVTAGPKGLIPVGWDLSSGNWIALGAKDPSPWALAWFDNTVNDARVTKIADGTKEVQALSARNALDAKLGGDRSLTAPSDMTDLIVDLLRNPKAQRWSALAPCYVGQRYEIWLGPGGRGKNLLWSEDTHVAPHSKTYSDNFNRADGDLQGSVFSDGSTVAWEDSGPWTVTSNAAAIVDQGDGVSAAANTTVDTDTDDMFTQVTMTVYSRTAGTTFYSGPVARNNKPGNPGSGYVFYVGRSNTDAFVRILYDGGNGSTLTSDAVDSTLKTQKITANGSTVSAYIDGVLALGPVTGTASPGQPGNRRGGLSSFSAGVATNDVSFDNFSFGDLSQTSLARPKSLRPRLFAPGLGR